MPDKLKVKAPVAKKAVKDIKHFNTIEALGSIIDASKMPMFMPSTAERPIDKVVIVASKDSGKTFPVDCYKIYCMEKDDMASTLGLKKYKTGAGVRLSESFNRALISIKREGFTLKNDYEKSLTKFYRKNKSKNRLDWQYQELGSFEDANGIAGATPSNGGYFAVIHGEEVAQQDDNNTVERKAWDAQVKLIRDSVIRFGEDYEDALAAATTEYYKPLETRPPIAMREFYTLNDWDMDHPLSIDTEYYHKREAFLSWALGMDPKLIMGNKGLVDKYWESIKESVITNHTKWVYVKTDMMGAAHNTLYGRMTKFANPRVKKNKDRMDKIYAAMYQALITGDTLELARVFGMGYEGSEELQQRFNFHTLDGIDTDAKLKEQGRVLLGYSTGWDHDANRGPVAVPVTISALRVNLGGPHEPEWVLKDWKVMLHGGVGIEGYGKGVRGENTKRYHEMMKDVSKTLYEKYVGYSRKPQFGSYCVWDDDDGSYTGYIADDMAKIGYSWADSIENKTGKNWETGFGTEIRDKIWFAGIESDVIKIDAANVEIIDYLWNVPKDPLTEKRTKKGKWGTRLKDWINAAEYGWWPFRYHLMRNLEIDR